MTLLHRALEFAVQAHSGQDRDGKHPLPYATHPVEVAANLSRLGGVTDDADLCAAFLHDVIEETSVTVEDLHREFGEEIASLVASVTREEPTADQTKGLSKDEIYQMRTGMLLEEISRMGSRSQRIKLADRLSNLTEAEFTRSGDKLRRYYDQTKKILAIIPREVCPPLWDAVSDFVKERS